MLGPCFVAVEVVEKVITRDKCLVVEDIDTGMATLFDAIFETACSRSAFRVR